jgi:hypothetical protein
MHLGIRTKLWLDLFIFLAFLVSMQPALTGVSLHEWFTVAIIATFVVHILGQWSWILAVGRRFFQRWFHVSRLNFVLDLALFLAMITVFVSGFVISRSFLPFFGIEVEPSFFWRRIHDVSANLTLLIVAIHVGLHWDWVVSAVKRYVFGWWPRLRVRETPTVS